MFATNQAELPWRPMSVSLRALSAHAFHQNGLWCSALCRFPAENDLGSELLIALSWNIEVHDRWRLRLAVVLSFINKRSTDNA
jgi:hypothetical protein